MLGKNSACIADGITISKIYNSLIHCSRIFRLQYYCEIRFIMCLQNVNSTGIVIDL